MIVAEIDAAAADAGRERIERSLTQAVDRGKLTEAERDAALGRLTFTTDIGELADRQLVVEAVVEDEALKTEVFRRWTSVVSDGGDPGVEHQLDPSDEAGHRHPTTRAGRRHPLLQPGAGAARWSSSCQPADSPETASRAETFATETLEKKVIRSQDRAGFIVNALLIPYILSSIRMMESGFATAVDIDTGMVEGCNHPMGPLHLADLIGLDTTLAVADSLYTEFKEPLYAPPPLLSRMVEAGLLGAKPAAASTTYER